VGKFDVCANLKKSTTPSAGIRIKTNSIRLIMKKEFFAGKTVLVMGLGRFGGGVDVVRFACKAGAKVTVTDLATCEQLAESVGQLADLPDIEFHLGSHNPQDFKNADIVVVNPAVPPDSEFLKIARQHHKTITSQINIFFQLCPAKIIGITGSNGKSTTAALTAHLLRSTSSERRATSDKHVWLSGNIGNRPLLTLLDRICSDDLVVLELSSFQLKQSEQIRKGPSVAVLTNLTPNHLDRHRTFADYCNCKENIFRFQKPDANNPAVSVFCAEDAVGCKWFEKYNSEPGRICIKFSAEDVSKKIRENFALPGKANLLNLSAAAAVARYFGVTDEQVKNCLPDFKALPHRLEFIREVNGVRWFNDSIATTPESSIAALEAFEQPKIIIAGGYDKNLPFEQLGQVIARKAKKAVLLGATAGKIANAILNGSEKNAIDNKVQVHIVDSLEDAVDLANQTAAAGDVVLLSPACASFDMFDNFQQRGRKFIKLVWEL